MDKGRMPRWKARERTFAVGIHYSEGGNMVRMPMPLIRMMGEPRPDKIVFNVDKDGTIYVTRDDA